MSGENRGEVRTEEGGRIEEGAREVVKTEQCEMRTEEGGREDR